MSANHRISTWATVLIAALLLTACNPLSPEAELPVSAPARPAPLLSIHNPLVIPIGDTPASAGGPFYGWQGFENEQHGLTIFYPNGWLFASSQEELLSFLPQLADAYLKDRASYLDSLRPPGQEPRDVGTGFPFDADIPPSDTNGFQLLTIPSEGRTLELFAQQLADQLTASGSAAVESIEVGPGLRPWGEETATVTYRIDAALAFGERAGAIPDANALGRQVVLLSPDGETFLTATFDVWGEYPQWLERLMLEVVRRVQWTDNPAYIPQSGPTVTLNDNMNVRAGPSTDHPIIAKAAAGQQLAAISSSPAGDWWQVEFNGRLAWLHGAYLTTSADAENAPQADPAGWLTYDDNARGLAISYPPGWHYLDPARPTQADLAFLSAAQKVETEQLDVAAMGQLVSEMSRRRDDAVIGLGLQADQPDSPASNFMLLFSFPAGGLTLEHYAQMAAENTYSLSPATVELTQGLRPADEQVVSIRYLENETNSEVWQVWLLSPDGTTLLALTFSVHTDQFESLEPLLSQIVQRLRWIESTG